MSRAGHPPLPSVAYNLNSLIVETAERQGKLRGKSREGAIATVTGTSSRQQTGRQTAGSTAGGPYSPVPELREAWDTLNRYLSHAFHQRQTVRIPSFATLGWTLQRIRQHASNTGEEATHPPPAAVPKTPGGTQCSAAVYFPNFNLSESFCQAFGLTFVRARGPFGAQDSTKCEDLNLSLMALRFSRGLTKQALAFDLKLLLQQLGGIVSISFEVGRLISSSRRVRFVFNQPQYNRRVPSASSTQSATPIPSPSTHPYQPSKDFQLPSIRQVKNDFYGQTQTRSRTATGTQRSNRHQHQQHQQHQQAEEVPAAAAAACEQPTGDTCQRPQMSAEGRWSFERSKDGAEILTRLPGSGDGEGGDNRDRDMPSGCVPPPAAQQQPMREEPTPSVKEPPIPVPVGRQSFQSGGASPPKGVVSAMEGALDRAVTQLEVEAAQALREREIHEERLQHAHEEEKRAQMDKRRRQALHREYLEGQIKWDRERAKRDKDEYIQAASCHEFPKWSEPPPDEMRDIIRRKKLEVKKELDNQVAVNRQLRESDRTKEQLFEKELLATTHEELASLSRNEQLWKAYEREALNQAWDREVRMKRIMKQVARHPSHPALLSLAKPALSPSPEPQCTNNHPNNTAALRGDLCSRQRRRTPVMGASMSLQCMRDREEKAREDAQRGR
ncbi:unnamed protein product [Vitrella brassicaformis CCMP3155]|uniref:CCDC81 HU domain-containing protein n=1 Tax=Vitrella brassicaformis (strain CCMP3155) TaxID=1169540 RepID=A0A0G4FWF3_VITBC|nr:unnamed protein product [Vitrella brassicaformis CCMP3155]|eukprot:CEM19543.1 unnamed protein product [Vitrella brassicaformis CCMP3155]